MFVVSLGFALLNMYQQVLMYLASRLSDIAGKELYSGWVVCLWIQESCIAVTVSLLQLFTERNVTLLPTVQCHVINISLSSCTQLDAFNRFLVVNHLRHIRFVLALRWTLTFTESFPNPLKPNLVYTSLKNSVRTSKKTPHLTITKINWLTPFKEIIPVYTENHKNPYIQNASLLIVKVSGEHSYRSALKG
jgi:hypothetical protein